jgi:hypothetical protein
MTDPVKRSARQLVLPLNSAMLDLSLFAAIRDEAVAALADLLLEAMGEEFSAPANEQEVRDEL